MIHKFLGIQSYSKTYDLMKNFTVTRESNTLDEIWYLEHSKVFTQGQAGRPEHILQQSDIEIVKTDRGGQITYHGPGQLVVYPLLNLARFDLNIKSFVGLLEQAIINTLRVFNIPSKTICNAPGVYVAKEKIASIGLRIKKGCSYHGIALNVNMDLQPFRYINPCGFKDLKMTQIANFIPDIKISIVLETLKKELCIALEQCNV